MSWRRPTLRRFVERLREGPRPARVEDATGKFRGFEAVI